MKKRGLKNNKLILWFGLIFILSVLAFSAIATDVAEEVIEQLTEEDTVEVIVFLKNENVPEGAELLEERKEEIKDIQEELFDDVDAVIENGNLGITQEVDILIEQQFSVINGFSGEVTQEGLEKLEDSDLVERVLPVFPITLLLDDSLPQINGSITHNLTLDGVNINGTGQSICVLDTGVDYTHPALGGCTSEEFLAGNCSKVISGYDHADGDSDPYPSGSYSSVDHGTHVAGIAAGEDDTYKGVAPGASIVAMKVFKDSGAGNTAWAIAAIDECISNSTVYNISVITMSIGVTSGGQEVHHTTHCDVAATSGFAAASSAAAAQGLFVDASSGNGGNSTGITSPACGENVTAVGRVSDDDSVFSSSNAAPILTLLAPGTSIIATTKGTGFVSKSGTSMAAPHIAGAAAVLTQYYETLHDYTPSFSELVSVMNSTGKTVLDSRNELNFSRIDLFSAITSLDNVTAEISFVSPTPSNSSTVQFSNTGNVTINITSDESLETVTLDWNGVNESMNGSGENFYLTKSNLTSGSYTFQVYITDYGNNTNETELRTVTLTSVPGITITVPENNTLYSSDFTLNVSISDGDNLEYANYSIFNSSSVDVLNNSNTSINTSSFNWTDTIDVSVLGEGDFSIEFFVNDSTGENASSTANFTVDSIVPAVFAENKTPSVVYNNDTVIFTANVTDVHLNTSAIYLSSNHTGSFVNYTMAGTGDEYRYNFSGNLSNQETVGWQVIARDLAGNENISTLFSFTVENRNVSELTIVTPANNSVIEVGDVTSFNSTATDDDNDALTFGWDFNDSSTSNLQNTTHQYTTTETYSVNVNVTDSYSVSTLGVTVIVNDTVSPTTESITYSSEHHIERDGDNYTVNATLFDYSGVLSTALFFNNTTQTASCSSNSTSMSCNWGLENLSIGSYNFVVNTTDNFTVQHVNSTTYNFSITS